MDYTGYGIGLGMAGISMIFPLLIMIVKITLIIISVKNILIQQRHRSSEWKIIWAMVAIMAPLGAIVYLLIGQNMED